MNDIVLFWAGCWVCCMLLAGKQFNPSWTAIFIFALFGPLLLVLEGISRWKRRKRK